MSLPTAANFSLSQINSVARFTNGNLGIGTISPQYKLDIIGTVNANTFYQNGIIYDSKFNINNTFNNSYTSGTTITSGSPIIVNKSDQVNLLNAVYLPTSTSNGNYFTITNTGSTRGSSSGYFRGLGSELYVRMGNSSTSGTVAKLNKGDTLKAVATTNNPIRPSDYLSLITRQRGNDGRFLWREANITNSRNWSSICWSPQLGLFCVLCSNAAVIMTSPDGAIWTERSIPNSRNWVSISWSSELGLFCAVNSGSAAFVMTSADGVSWTERSIPNTRNWCSVWWAAEIGLFCAVNYGSAAVVMTSADGVSWTERSIPNNRNWQSVCWSPQLGLFCAVNEGSAAFVMTSPDGINWTERSIPNNRNWESLAWSSQLSLFCAVNNSSAAVVMTSADGITWTERSIPTNRNWLSICWAHEIGLFCAVNNNNAAVVMTSPDGINWTERSIPNTRAWFNVCWSQELMSFCAVSNNSSSILISGLPIYSNFMSSLGTVNSFPASLNLTSYTSDPVGLGVTYSLTSNPYSRANLTGNTLTVSSGSGVSSYTISVSAINFDGFIASSSLTINENNALYTFTSFTFTNATATGRNGPTLSQVQSAYSATSWTQNTSYLNMTTQGIQLWTVPQTGNYTITCVGARGGSGPTYTGGYGTSCIGTFSLTRGNVLQILVGQLGQNRNGVGQNTCEGAGGGGTFVAQNNTPLIVAGGGGGSGYIANGINASTSTSGASGGTNGGAGGINGGGGGGALNGGAGNGSTVGGTGTSCSFGSGGGGFYSRGGYNCDGSTPLISGFSFLDGGMGGPADTAKGGVEGGFGGGAGIGHRSPGGGGYSGGGGNGGDGGGGGGGSYNSGTNQTNTISSNNNHGYVTITAL